MTMSETTANGIETQSPTNSSNNTTTSGQGNGSTNTRRGAANKHRPPVKKFKGKVEGIVTLAARNERTGYGFSVFTKSLYEYCLTHMKSPQDVAPVILERKDPFVEMGKNLPSTRSVAESLGTPLLEILDDDSAKEVARKEKHNAAVRRT